MDLSLDYPCSIRLKNGVVLHHTGDLAVSILRVCNLLADLLEQKVDLDHKYLACSLL